MHRRRCILEQGVSRGRRGDAVSHLVHRYRMLGLHNDWGGRRDKCAQGFVLIVIVVRNSVRVIGVAVLFTKYVRIGKHCACIIELALTSSASSASAARPSSSWPRISSSISSSASGVPSKSRSSMPSSSDELDMAALNEVKDVLPFVDSAITLPVHGRLTETYSSSSHSVRDGLSRPRTQAQCCTLVVKQGIGCRRKGTSKLTSITSLATNCQDTGS